MLKQVTSSSLPFVYLPKMLVCNSKISRSSTSTLFFLTDVCFACTWYIIAKNGVYQPEASKPLNLQLNQKQLFYRPQFSTQQLTAAYYAQKMASTNHLNIQFPTFHSKSSCFIAR